jgi:S-adenosylmethionine decarboxylase
MGTELVIDARGCDPSALRSRARLRCLFARIVDELGLSPLGDIWHVFPAPGAGITGLVLLTESHLTIHTFPETGVATINLYCCRRRPDWPWADRLRDAIGASGVEVREVTRA